MSASSPALPLSAAELAAYDEQVSALLAAASAQLSSAAAPQEPAAASWPKRHLTLYRLYDNDERMADVSDYAEGEEYVCALLSALKSTTCPLTDLKLVRIPSVGAQFMPQLAFVLARLPLLESLTLQECDITNERMATLANAIAAHPALKSLSLVGNNKVGDAGIAALVAAGLLKAPSAGRTNKGLARLDVGCVSGSTMTPLAARMVSSALSASVCTLSRLEWTGLSGSAAASALASNLQASRTLQHLALASSGLRGETLATIVDAGIANHPTIRVLSVGDATTEEAWTDDDFAILNRLFAAKAGADAAKCGSMVASLEVRTHATALTPAALLAFAHALDQSAQLRTVEVRFVDKEEAEIDTTRPQLAQYKEAMDAIKTTTMRNCKAQAVAAMAQRSSVASSSSGGSKSSPTKVAARSSGCEQVLPIAAAALAAAWVYFKWM